MMGRPHLFSGGRIHQKLANGHFAGGGLGNTSIVERMTPTMPLANVAFRNRQILAD